MALILAIEPDRRQAARLTNLIRARVGANLVLAETTEQALGAIGDRVPDLILIPALLAPQDDAALAAALRVIATAAHVQMLTIPVLAAAGQRNQPRSFMARWRLRAEPEASDGCDPAMFGEQIAAYLAEATAQRAGDDTALPLAEDISTEHAAVEPESILVPAIEPPAADPVVEELPAIVDAMEETPVVLAEELSIAKVVVEDLTAAIDAASITSLDEPTVYELQVDDLAMIDLSPDDDIPVSDPPAIEIAPIDAAIGRLDLWTLPSFGLQRELVRSAADLTTADAPVEAEQDDNAAAIDTDWFQEPAPVARLELWMPLSFGASRMWPSLDGVAAEDGQEAVAEEAEAACVPAAPVAAPAAPQVAHAAASEAASKPDWSELIASLRQDVQRLRTDRSQPTPSVARRQEQHPPSIASSQPQRPAGVADILARARKSATPARPAQDEWGLFDPEQCGFAALLAKLEEITHGTDESSARSA